jgi:hypothetical protein
MYSTSSLEEGFEGMHEGFVEERRKIIDWEKRVL